MQSRRGFALSYVKVEVRALSPRLWGWSLHRANSDVLIRRSGGAYGCAEDAWTAGQAAFADFEATAPRPRVEAPEEALDA